MKGRSSINPSTLARISTALTASTRPTYSEAGDTSSNCTGVTPTAGDCGCRARAAWPFRIRIDARPYNRSQYRTDVNRAADGTADMKQTGTRELFASVRRLRGFMDTIPSHRRHVVHYLARKDWKKIHSIVARHRNDDWRRLHILNLEKLSLEEDQFRQYKTRSVLIFKSDNHKFSHGRSPQTLTMRHPDSGKVSKLLECRT